MHIVPAPTAPLVSRAWHGVDLAGLAGVPHPSSDVMRRLWDVYRVGMRVTPTDQFWLGSSRSLLPTAMTALPPAGFRWFLHEDGLDVDLERLVERFKEVVLAGTAGFLLPVAEAAESAGLQVHHVIGQGGASPALAEIAHTSSCLVVPPSRFEVPRVHLRGFAA